MNLYFIFYTCFLNAYTYKKSSNHHQLYLLEINITQREKKNTFKCHYTSTLITNVNNNPFRSLSLRVI